MITVPPAHHWSNQAEIWILLHAHEVAWATVTNRNQRKTAIFCCAGMVPPAHHWSSQAEIGIILRMHEEAWATVADRNLRK